MQPNLKKVLIIQALIGDGIAPLGRLLGRPKSSQIWIKFIDVEKMFTNLKISAVFNKNHPKSLRKWKSSQFDFSYFKKFFYLKKKENKRMFGLLPLSAKPKYWRWLQSWPQFGWVPNYWRAPGPSGVRVHCVTNFWARRWRPICPPKIWRANRWPGQHRRDPNAP